MMRIVLWFVLAVTLLPYFYARTEYKLPAYVVAVMLMIWATSVFLLSPQGRRLVIYVARRSPHFLLYCALILISQSIAVFLTPEFGIFDYIWGLGYIIIGLIAYFVLPVVIGNKLFRPWLAFLVIVGAFSSAIAVYVAFTGETEVLGFNIRQLRPYGVLGIYSTSSIFYEANRFGISAFFGLLGSLYFLEKRQHTPLVALTLFLCAAGIVISWSRAVYLGLALAFPVWLLGITKPSHRRKAVVLLILLAISGLLIVIYIKPVNQALYGIGLARRKLFWSAAIQLIAKSPLVGYGFGSPEIVQSRLYAHTGFETAIHSTPLGIAFHAGIPVAVLYFIMFWVALKHLKNAKLDRPARATIATGVIVSFFAAFFLDYTPGGISYGTLIYTTFLGLANASPWLRLMRKSVLKD